MCVLIACREEIAGHQVVVRRYSGKTDGKKGPAWPGLRVISTTEAELAPVMMATRWDNRPMDVEAIIRSFWLGL